MPKRPKTPPIEDDAKYLTVVRPYPAHPNMEREEHRREFARWIASCTGAFYFRAFYHKPTSPGSVIIEIDETFPDFKRLLGAHKWSEFLVDPGDEAAFVSKIYYCTWNSDRDVQKNGWKRIDVQDKWFKSKAASKFVSPYPTTHWCDVPRERNVIHNPLCRPLPRSDFPPPPPEPVPVVGTPEWQAWKERQNTRVVTAKTRAMLQTTTGAPPVTAPPSVGSTPTASRTASSAGEPVGQPASRGFVWSNATTPLTPPGLPPGLTRGGSSSGCSQRSTGGRSAWGELAASHRSASPLPAPTSGGTSSGDDPTPKTPGADEPDMVAGSRIEGALVALSVDDYEDDIYLGIDGEPTDYVGASDVLYMPNANAVSPSGPSIPDAAIHNEDNRESDDDDDDDDLPQMVGDKKICPEHNVVCNKGICRVYAAMLREEKREKERQEREKARAEAKAKREKAQNKRGKNSFFKPLPSSGPNFPTSPSGREPPPHLRAGAPPPSSAPRPLPPHLKPGAPPPTPSSSAPKQMPAHLQRGASASSQPRPAPDPAGRVTPTPSRQGGESDERSEAGGWDNASEGPWGSYAKPPDDRKKNWAQAKTFVPAARPPKAPSHGQEFGAWGKAPSVSASSVRRNNDSWSVSAPSEAGDGDAGTGDGWQTTVATDILKNKPTGREFGAWGKAPSVTASSVRRNNDSWSVSAPSEVGDTSNDNDNGWRTATESKAKKKDKKKEREFGAWGKAPSVSASSVRRNHDSWSVSARSDAGGPGADGHHDDARSVAASDDGNWGRPPSVVGQAGRSWADQMDEEDEANAAPEPDDDARSVAASTVSGWGSVSAGPW